jgi:hypothetical protein
MATDEVVAAARLRLLLDERLGRETPHEVIRLAGGEAAPPDQLTVVVDLAEFEESAQAALRGFAEQGLVSWLLRIGMDVVEEAGEEAVREVGRLLLAECGPADLLSRLGAGEFVALVSRNPKDGVGGADVAERMRRVVAEHPWTTPVRLNIGVAAAPPDRPVKVTSLRARSALAVATASGGVRVATEQANRPGTPHQGEGWSIPSRRKRP